ncbi:MAG: iron complex transport system permease protein [Alphaproteobacteria bacterium]|nr:iron complex transport system permease protein [Alphaproteobacteria bacterium]
MRNGVFVLLLGALFAALLLGLAVGPYPLGFADVLHAAARAVGVDNGAPTPGEIVFGRVRLPRVAAGMLVGAALAGAGTTYQTLFRNPLVSPDILGVATGAGLGAVAGILLSLPVAGIQGLAFVGGLATVGLVYVIAAALRGHDRTLVLVLGGVVVGALAGACISLVKILADPYDQLPAITFWLLGSLASVKLADLATVGPLVLAGLVPLVLFRWRIGVLSLGDDEARSLGVDVFRLRALVIGAATLMTASVVAVSGVIGWVGLMIPHIARMLVGPNFSRLLPASMLLGASFMLIVDMAARSIARVETPLGILTAVLGAPFFLWLLARGRRTWG